MLTKILRKNTSPARIAGFLLSNFIGMAIVLGALQFYSDAGTIWESDDSFISSDLLVVNHRVTSANTLGEKNSSFTQEEIAEIAAQPWVRSVDPFTANDFRVNASVNTGRHGMTTAMFFESIPDKYVDVPAGQWAWEPGSNEVPIIIPRDYLSLYNFGFAGSAGLPQMSEGIIGAVPLTLQLQSEDGSRSLTLYGRIAGFSNKLNTILVPEAFMHEANSMLGTDYAAKQPSRLAIDTNSPGDTAIREYLDQHDLEISGDKTATSAAFLLRLVTGIVLAVGGIITLLSIGILMLSVSLIMERSRGKIHNLLMLGYPVWRIGKPYFLLTLWSSVGALALALTAVFGLRAWYLEPLRGLGAGSGSAWISVCVGAGLTIIVICANYLAIRNRVRGAFRT